MSPSSHYWRADLRRRAKTLRDKEEQFRWGDDALDILEQTVVLGFYAIRKLEVYGWLAPKKLNRKIVIVEFSHLAGAPSHPSHDELGKSYQMEKGMEIEKDVAFLEHQLSHTHFFETDLNKNNHPLGFYFTSDHQKRKALYYVELQEVITIFEDVAHIEV